MKFTFSHRGESSWWWCDSSWEEHAWTITPFHLIDNAYLPEVLQGCFSVQGTPIYIRTSTWCQPNVWLSSVIWNRVMANLETSVSLIMECRPLSTAHHACAPLANLTVCPFFTVVACQLMLHISNYYSLVHPLFLFKSREVIIFSCRHTSIIDVAPDSTLLSLLSGGPLAGVIPDPTTFGRRYYYRLTNWATYWSLLIDFCNYHRSVIHLSSDNVSLIV